MPLRNTFHTHHQQIVLFVILSQKEFTFSHLEGYDLFQGYKVEIFQQSQFNVMVSSGYPCHVTIKNWL